jgi:hypothetical protein
MSSSNGKNIKENEKGFIADADALAAQVRGAQTSSAAKSALAQLFALMGLAGGSSGAVSAISKAISGAGSIISQLEKAEQEALAQRMADTQTLREGVDKFMSAEEKEYLNKINPEEYYNVHTFDENGNVNGTKRVQGWEIQESYILLKAEKHRGDLNSEQLEALNRKLYYNSKGQFDPSLGRTRLNDAANMIRGDLSANAADRKISNQQEIILNSLIDQIAPTRMKTGYDSAVVNLADVEVKRVFAIRRLEKVAEEIKTEEVKKANDLSNAATDEISNIITNPKYAQGENNNDISPEEKALMENFRKNGSIQTATTLAMLAEKKSTGATINIVQTPAIAPTLAVTLTPTANTMAAAQLPANEVTADKARATVDGNKTANIQTLPTVTNANEKAMLNGFLAKQQPETVPATITTSGVKTETTPATITTAPIAITETRPEVLVQMIKDESQANKGKPPVSTIASPETKTTPNATASADADDDEIAAIFRNTVIPPSKTVLQQAPVSITTASVNVSKPDIEETTIMLKPAATPKLATASSNIPPTVSATPATPAVAISATNAGVIAAPPPAIPNANIIETPATARLASMHDNGNGLASISTTLPVSTRTSTNQRQ